MIAAVTVVVDVTVQLLILHYVATTTIAPSSLSIIIFKYSSLDLKMFKRLNVKKICKSILHATM